MDSSMLDTALEVQRLQQRSGNLLLVLHHLQVCLAHQLLPIRVQDPQIMIQVSQMSLRLPSIPVDFDHGVSGLCVAWYKRCQSGPCWERSQLSQNHRARFCVM